jgi:hypothetical protein
MTAPPGTRELQHSEWEVAVMENGIYEQKNKKKIKAS